MPELTTPDGKKIDLVDVAEQDFSRALAAPPTDDGLSAPPKREAPGDQDGAGSPRHAPKVEAKEAKPAAKPSKQPRVKAAVSKKADYTEEISALVSNAWVVTASIPQTQGYALVLRNSADGLVSALNAGAKANDTVARFVSGAGENAWYISLAAVGAQMALQGYQLYKDENLRAQCAEATRKQLAAMVAPIEGSDKPEAE